MRTMGYSKDEVKATLRRLSSTTLANSPKNSECAFRGEAGSASTFIVAGLFLGYTCYCALRRSFPQQMPILGHELGIPHSQLGLPNSVFAVTYAISKFGGAVASDHLPCTKCHVVGLVLCGLACSMLGMCTSLGSFVLVWGLQGLLQGFGWPTLVRIVVSELPAHSRSKHWGILSTSGNVGQMLGPYAMAVAVAAGASWRAVFFGFGIFVIAMAFPVWLLLSNGTCDEGATDSSRKDTDESKVQASRSKWDALCNPALVALMICNGLCYFVRNSVAEWGLIYTQSTNLASSHMQATTLLFWMEAGGSFGAFCSGYLSSMLGSRLGMTTFLSASVLSMSMTAITMSAHRGASMSSSMGLQDIEASVLQFGVLCALHAVAGVGLHGVRSLLGLHAATIASDSGSVGMTNGLLEVVGQLGCVAAGQPLGALATWGGGATTKTGAATISGSGWVFALVAITLASTVITVVHVPLLFFEERRLARASLDCKKKTP